MSSPGIAHALFPALGFFGGSTSDALVLPLGTIRVQRIRLSVSDGDRTILNLAGLELLRGGKPLVLDPASFETRQSSTYDDDPRFGGDSLITRRGIHSKGEPEPSWEISFSSPQSADAVRVFNRSDGWGRRSRSLRIEIEDDTGRTSVRHVGHGIDDAVATMLRLLAISGFAAAPASIPTTAREAESLRVRWIEQIARGVLDRSIAIMDLPVPATLTLIRVWDDQPLSREERIVLAAYLLAQRKASVATSFSGLAFCLRSRSQLLALQDAMDEVSAAQGWPLYILTRHGIHPAVLRNDAERHLAFLEKMLVRLDELGHEPVIAYGTLLGAIRDERFIPHDDDVDVLYRVEASTRGECEARVWKLAESLRASGFGVNVLLPATMNMHVIEPETSTVIDLFPTWEQDGLLQLHMDGMKIRGIDPTIIYPRSRTTLHGRSFVAPAQGTRFLEERYGAAWARPDRFFEWPWPLLD